MPTLIRSVEDARAQQIGTGIELTARRKDGSEFPMELMLSPLESDGGVLVTVAIRDITARKAAEALLLRNMEELNRSNEELQQFAYVASHDLQEPLRMVASYVALIARRYRGKLDADADEFIGFAVDGSKRMQSLIQDLLSYSRVGSKGKDLVETSSEDALAQAIRNLGGVIAESGALVTHDPLPAVMADEMQLTQLFQNLLGNAIKYRRAETPGSAHRRRSERRQEMGVLGAGQWIGHRARSTSREFSACFSGCTAARNSPARELASPFAKDRRAPRRQHFRGVRDRPGLHVPLPPVRVERAVGLTARSHPAGQNRLGQACFKRPRRKSAMISRAELWPGAPVTPPPGWVPAPHMYRPLRGPR